MMPPDILRAFLVKLGFQIDASGERKFVDTVASMTVNAVKLGAAVTAASASVTAGVAKIAVGLESLHFASQRTRASVANIQAFGFAAAQMGGSAEGAQASLEHLARLMRTNPGTSGLLHSLGVDTQDAQGRLRDTSKILIDLGERFKRMPYWRANAYAQALGIDEKTLMALQQGLGQFGDTYRDMLRAAGLDSEQAAQSSHAFMNELRLLGAAAGILKKKVASSLTGDMSANIKRLREFLVAHFDQIAKAIQSIVGWILKAADVTGTLSIRAMQAVNALVNWFNGLSGSGQNLVKMFGVMLMAWRLLSKGFMSTPLGRVMALAAALLLLWDDYQTWKEGGESLIDWAKWEPAIDSAIEALNTLCDWLGKGAEAIGGWKTVAEVVLTYFTVKWAVGMIRAIGKVGKALSSLRTPRVPTGTPSESSNKAYQSGARAGRAVKWLLKGGRLLKGGVGIAALLHSESLNTGEDEEIKRIRQKERQRMQRRNPDHTTLDTDQKGSAAAIAEFFKRKGWTQNQAAGIAAKLMVDAQQRPDALSAIPQPVSTANGHEPRGIRNHNPGNIEYGRFARSHGALGSDGRFAQFRSAEAGLKALADLLQVYAKKGIDTIRSIIARFAPAHENNTKAYIASVAKRLGFDADAKLDMRDSRVIAGLMNAIVRVENGQNPYSADRVEQIAAENTANAPSTVAVHEGGRSPWGAGVFNLNTEPFDFNRAAQAVAATKAVNPYRIESRARLPDAEPGRASTTSDISMNQTLNITVNGVSDPQEAADAIQHAQQNVNARMIRNLRGAIVV